MLLVAARTAAAAAALAVTDPLSSSTLSVFLPLLPILRILLVYVNVRLLPCALLSHVAASSHISGALAGVAALVALLGLLPVATASSRRLDCCREYLQQFAA